jgi:hypothetical protein
MSISFAGKYTKKDTRNEQGYKEAYPDKKALKIIAKARKKAVKKSK